MPTVPIIFHNSAAYEAIKYIVAGFATTAINFIAYFSISKISDCSPTLANAVAWVVSVLFAYAVNSRLVFRFKGNGVLTELKSFFGFAAARIFSAVAETACIFFFVEKRGFNDYAVKLAATVFVILFNYVISKFIIFAKKGRS